MSAPVMIWRSIRGGHHAGLNNTQIIPPPPPTQKNPNKKTNKKQPTQIPTTNPPKNQQQKQQQNKQNPTETNNNNPNPNKQKTNNKTTPNLSGISKSHGICCLVCGKEDIMETKYCRLPKIYKIHYLVVSLNKTNFKSYCTEQRFTYSSCLGFWGFFLNCYRLLSQRIQNLNNPLIAGVKKMGSLKE